MGDNIILIETTVFDTWAMVQFMNQPRFEVPVRNGWLEAPRCQSVTIATHKDNGSTPNWLFHFLAVGTSGK